MTHHPEGGGTSAILPGGRHTTARGMVFQLSPRSGGYTTALGRVLGPHSAPAGRPPHGGAGLCSFARRVDTPPPWVWYSGLIPLRRVHHRTGGRASVHSPGGWIHHRPGFGTPASFPTGGYTTARGSGPLFIRPAGGYTTALGLVLRPHSAPAGTPPHGGAGLCSFARRVDTPPCREVWAAFVPSLSGGGCLPSFPPVGLGGHPEPLSPGVSRIAKSRKARFPRFRVTAGRAWFCQSRSVLPFPLPVGQGNSLPAKCQGGAASPRPSRPGVHGVCTYPESRLRIRFPSNLGKAAVWF